MIALMVVTTTPAMLMGFREIIANRFFIVMDADGVCFNPTSVSSGAGLRKTRSTIAHRGNRGCDMCYRTRARSLSHQEIEGLARYLYVVMGGRLELHKQPVFRDTFPELLKAMENQ
jgi:hypothetical protein